MEQEKKNSTVEKEFDAETEWLIDEYKEQQEKDRIETDMEAEDRAKELADDDALYIDDVDDIDLDDPGPLGLDPSDAMSAEDFFKMVKSKAKS